MSEFGERLKGLRTGAELSQKELSEKSGITVRTIQNYELGVTNPRNMITLSALARALDTTPEYLLGTAGIIIAETYETEGAKAAKEIGKLVSEVKGVFAGGQLDDEALDGVMKALQEAYWIAKAENKKYAKKNTQKTDDSEN